MNHRKRTRPGDARGFTLVETMVALVLFTIIGVAVYQILIHTSQSERVSTTVAEAQQNARVALDTILRDLRQAGYGIDTSSEVPIETASEYRVTFVIDQDADGVIEAGERITYFMDDNAADPIVAASPNPDDFVLRRVISSDADSLALPGSGRGDVIAYGVTQRTPNNSSWNVRLFDYFAEDGTSLISGTVDPDGSEFGFTVPDTALGKPAGSLLPIQFEAVRVSVVTEASHQDPETHSYKQVRVTGTIHPRNIGLSGAFAPGIAIPTGTETGTETSTSTETATETATETETESTLPPQEPPIRIPTETVLSMELADLNELDSQEGSLVTVDGQHDLDLVVGTQLSGTNNLYVWFEGYPDKYDGERYYNVSANYMGTSTRAINALASGNLNGGDPLARDMVAAVSASETSGGFTVWLNQAAAHPGWLGTGSSPVLPNALYSNASGKGQTIALGDFNQDGYPDVVLGTRTGNATGKIEFWYNNGSGAFTFFRSYTASGEVTSVAVAGFDANPYPDIVVGTKTAMDDRSGKLEIWLNNSGTSFTNSGLYTAGGKVTDIAVADMNGDNKRDVVAGVKSGLDAGKVELWIGDNSGHLNLGDSANTDHIPNCVAVGAIDYGNTSPDIVVGTSSRQVQVWFCDDDANSNSSIIPVFESWSDANVGGVVTALAIGKIEAPWTMSSLDLLNDIICGTSVTATTGEIVIYLNPYVWSLTP